MSIDDSVQPFGMSSYSDRIGRSRMVLGSCVLSIPGGLLLFPLIDLASPFAFFVELSLALVIMGISYGPAGALLPEMFSAEYCYTGAGMAYAIAGMIGGGTAPTFAAEPAGRHGSHVVGWMLAAFGVLSLICAVFLRETRHRAMEHSSRNSDKRAAIETH